MNEVKNGSSIVTGEFYPGCTVKVWETGWHDTVLDKSFNYVNVSIKREGFDDQFFRFETIDHPKGTAEKALKDLSI